MSTRQSTTAPTTVPTVTAYATDGVRPGGDGPWTVRVCHPDAAPIALPATDRLHAGRLSAALRGMLAHAYSAGRTEEKLSATQAPGIAGVTEEWNGNGYRVEILADVEANSPEEAQELTGLLLAGHPTPQGHPAAPLTGPGSWAVHKRIERYEVNREDPEFPARIIVGDPTDLVHPLPWMANGDYYRRPVRP